MIVPTKPYAIRINGALTLITETETYTYTETDKMATLLHDIGVSVQYEHLHEVQNKPFLSVLVSVSVSVRVNVQ